MPANRPTLQLNLTQEGGIQPLITSLGSMMHEGSFNLVREFGDRIIALQEQNSQALQQQGVAGLRPCGTEQGHSQQLYK